MTSVLATVTYRWGEVFKPTIEAAFWSRYYMYVRKEQM